MNAHQEIRSEVLKVGTEKWTEAALCIQCWVQEEPDRLPYTLNAEHRQDEICYSCHIPTRSGIYARRRCVVKALNRQLFWAKIVDAGKPETGETRGVGLRPGQLG